MTTRSTAHITLGPIYNEWKDGKETDPDSEVVEDMSILVVEVDARVSIQALSVLRGSSE